MSAYLSWGRFFRFKQEARRLDWMPADVSSLLGPETSVLPYGCGRSYGDSCLNDNGVLLDTRPLNHIISFDEKTGVLTCESGMTFADVLAFALPRGWFLPVTPGTKYVTLGGAIANDVHGKNHHGSGTFGRHVRRMGLARSEEGILECSPLHHSDLFNATIGGVGLTGLILWAEIQLLKVPGPYCQVETVPFGNIKEFAAIAKESERYAYTVAWLDTTAPLRRLGRGVFLRGEHVAHQAPDLKMPTPFPVPFEAPNWLLNRWSIRAFNEAYYRVQRVKPRLSIQHYEPYFYPLDKLAQWNKLYGKRGFFQYQLVVPHEELPLIETILKMCVQRGQASFLTVLKTFGSLRSPGIMSFPMPGVTLNLDFPFKGETTLKLMEEMDAMVVAAKGRVYPAKDSVMSPESFRAFFPQWEEFQKHIDPKFSSSFWRRVTA